MHSLLNPVSGTQTVNSIVKLAKAIHADGDVTANKSVIIKSGAIKTELNYNDGTFNVKYTGNTHNYQLSLIDGIGFRFYANGTLIATIGASSITFNQPVSASKGTFSGLVLTENHIYQGTANAVGEIGINVHGYNGGHTQFRNTHIGDGKGKIIFSIIGSDGNANIYGVTKIESGATDGLILKAKVLKENNSLTNAISWRDSANTVRHVLDSLAQLTKCFLLLHLHIILTL